MHGQSPASPEGGRYLSRVGGGVVALGQTGERHPWISFFHEDPLRIPESGFIRGGEDPFIIESLDPTGVQDSPALAEVSEEAATGVIFCAHRWHCARLRCWQL